MKYIPYAKQTIDKSDIDAVVKVLKSDWITQGPVIQRFEKALCEYVGVKYAVAVSSGTAALHIACLASGIKKRDEVITSPITFVTSANCILYCGGKPIFADIQEDTLNVDPEKIKEKITRRTKALIPVHFAGHPCDLKEIKHIAQKHNLSIIEDAAHALGAEYKNRKVGSCKYSDMTVFSFHPVKHITSGEGGVVTTNRKDLYEKLFLLRTHGITKDKRKLREWNAPWYYEQHLLGFNYRITDFQCALGLSQLKKLDVFLKKRRQLADFYNKELSDLNEIILPVERPTVNSAWHIYPIRIRNCSQRKRIFNALRDSNIGVQVHYIPVHLQPYYRDNFGYKKNDYPKAENYYKETITIPLYPGMKAAEIKYIVKTLKKLLK